MLKRATVLQTSPRPARGMVARVCLVLSLLLALGSHALPARAAPDVQSDAVLRFLSERGLLDVTTTADAEPGLVERVRDAASDMVITAMNFLDVPYRRGGNSAEDGFDCSGFTRYVFEMSLGLVLPRRSDEQASAPGLVAVGRAELKPGDLVFFNTLRRAFSHVGIYVGNGKFIHAPRSGAAVRMEDMRYAYWAKRYNGARRPSLAETPAPPAPETSPEESGNELAPQP
ncbi:MAG: C40 family peptidase [Burkholderiaceae bacterium]|nr:C40 family peptidase [Burkholderiaceae bacterium]MDH3459643.1 C40 family peptidase [Burkholderiaceae bacterium]